MSGGAFDYAQRNLGYEMFGFGMSCDYGEDGHKLAKDARKINPMHDRELSELVWDTICLIHSLDWYQSGDTDEDTYNADAKWFKNKWLKRTEQDTLEAYKQDMRDFAEELIHELETCSFNWGGGDDGGQN